MSHHNAQWTSTRASINTGKRKKHYVITCTLYTFGVLFTGKTVNTWTILKTKQLHGHGLIMRFTQEATL